MLAQNGERQGADLAVRGRYPASGRRSASKERAKFNSNANRVPSVIPAMFNPPMVSPLVPRPVPLENLRVLIAAAQEIRRREAEE